MKSKVSKTRFWMTLATVNVLAMGYPTNLVLRADTDLARLGAVFAFIAIVFLLFICDAIGVLIAYWL